MHQLIAGRRRPGEVIGPVPGFGTDVSTCSFDDYTLVRRVMDDGTAAVRKHWHRTVFTGPEARGES